MHIDNYALFIGNSMILDIYHLEGINGIDHLILPFARQEVNREKN